MSKYQDGEYIHLYFEDDPNWRLIKGWHDVQHCQEQLKEFYGEDAPFVTGVMQQYGFWGVRNDPYGNVCQWFYERKTPGRGRFKVTLAVVDGLFADQPSGGAE